jgi:hypothetical protein
MKKQNKKLLTVPLFLLIFLFLVMIISTTSNAYNNEYVNVTTRANITNTGPEILNITVGVNGNITLSAGTNYTMLCNISVRDYNGWNDINSTNATFFYYLNSSNQSDDNNEHYTNQSCELIANDGQYIANYTCRFFVTYYANNGTWYCEAMANDTDGYEATGNGSGLVDPLYALNVTDVIDFGSLTVGDYSANISANVTNYGNMDINVSVRGYGGTDPSATTLAMICTQGNISISNERYTLNSTYDWAIQTPITSSDVDLGMNVFRRIDDTQESINYTYWSLYVPPNPFGLCNGTVVFTATIPP